MFYASEKIHENHLGVTQFKSLARQMLYRREWPDIETFGFEM